MTSTPSVPPGSRPGPVTGTGVPDQRAGEPGEAGEVEPPFEGVAGLTPVARLRRDVHTAVHRVRRGGTEYALTLLDRPPADEAAARAAVAAFRRRSAILATALHPGLTRLHEAGDDARGRPFAVRDIAPGRALDEVLATGPLPPEQALAVAADVAAALAALHRVGLAHGDVAPRSVVLAGSGEARLIDVTLVGNPPLRADIRDLGRLLLELVPHPHPGLERVIEALTTDDVAAGYVGADDAAADLQRAARAPDAAFRPTRHDVTLSRRTGTRLCGRDTEFARLADAWGRAVDGHGGTAVVRGAPGTGKTRLALEIAGHARGQGALALHGAAVADDPVPLAPLRVAVDDHLRACASLPGPERDAAYGRLRVAAGPSADLLGRLSPGLAAVLDAQEPPAGAGADQFATAVGGFLGDLARDAGGLLLLLDDVHWLDPATRRVLRVVSAEAAAAPLLVVATSRDDGTSLGVPVATDVELGPLDAAGVRALVSAYLPGIDRGSELARLLIERSGGNPFDVQQYLRAVVDAGLLRPAWGTWLLDAGGLDGLPRESGGLVVAAIRGLGAVARDVLTTAAATGSRFDPALVGRACGRTPAEVAAVLAAAAPQHLVVARDDGRYAFTGERVREALAAVLGPGTPAVHAAIAAALEADAAAGSPGEGHVYAVAHHYLQAGSTAPAGRLAAACAAAGVAATADHAPSQAVTFFERAAAAGHPRDPDFLHVFGAALARAGRYGDALDRLREALRPETPTLTRAAILATIADTCRATWDSGGAHAAVDEALTTLGRRLPRATPLLVLTTLVRYLAGCLVAMTRIGAGTASGERRLRYELVARLHTIGGYVGTLTMRPDRLVVHNLNARFAVERIGPGPTYVRCTASLGFVLTMFGLRGAARRAFRRADRAATEAGDPPVRAMAAWYGGCAAFMNGRDNGESWSRALEEHGRWLDAGQFCDGVASICWEAISQGRTAEALAWYERTERRLAGLTGDDVTSTLMLGALTRALTGRTGPAAAELRAAEAVLALRPAPGLRINYSLAQVHVLHEQGELGEPFEDAVAAFRALGLRPARMLRQHRPFFLVHAFARLTQVRAARGDQRPVRLAVAREAVGLLEKVATTPALAAAALIARADLAVLEGRPERALELTARLRPLRPDAPLLEYEAARVRARACLATGLREEALRQATAAQAIAMVEGWPHRLRWLSTEFGVDVGGGPVRGRGPGGPGRAAAAAERRRPDALAEVARVSAGVLDPDTLIHRVLVAVTDLFAADRAALWIVDGRGDLRYVTGVDASGSVVADAGYRSGAVERARMTGQAQLANRAGVGGEARAVAATPLSLAGQGFGFVALEAPAGTFSREDAATLSAFGAPLAAALVTARAAREAETTAADRHRRELADALRTALGELAGVRAGDDILARLAAAAAHVLPAERTWIVPAADAPVLPRPVAGVGARGAPDAVALDIPGTWSWLAVPLPARGTPSPGVLVLAAADPDAYREPETALAAVLAAYAATAWENAVLQAGPAGPGPAD